jgi:phosphoglycolate phosphatase
MPIRLILYDLDGTLIDSREDLANAVNRTLTDLGLPTRPNAELHGFVGNGVRMLLVRAVGEGHGDRLDEALAVFRGHYLGHLTDHTRLYPGVERVLEALSARHQAIVTNKAMVYTEGLVRDLGLEGRIGLVLGGDSTGRLKPDPAMLVASMTHFGVAPEETVMVGDGVPDVEAARAAGVTSIGLTCGMGDPDLLRAARPDHVVDHIERILPVIDALDRLPPAVPTAPGNRPRPSRGVG